MTTPRIVAIDPNMPVTLTRTVIEWMAVATGILQAANDLVSGCENPATCTFCGATGMELQTLGLSILEELAAAGKQIPPAHTDN